MAEFSELVQALTWLVTNRIQQKIQYTHGLLGDGNGRVRVSTIPGSPEVDYVFVRPDRFSNRTFKVFNKRIEGQDGDPIIIGELPWEPGLVQVVDMDWATYADVGWGDDVTTTNRHGISHQWRDGAPGIDTFNVYRRQFGDLKTYSTISGTLAVGVSPYSLDIFGKQYQWPGTQDFSLAGALPTVTGTARMALVYWSPASGTTQGFLGVATGTLGSGAEATILNRPVSPQGVIPSAFVRLAGGQSSITEFDIWDAREPFRPGLSFGTGTAGLSADMIPISDVVGFYTGSTVEAALAEVPYKLISPDGGINPVLSADNSGDVTLAGTGTFAIPLHLEHVSDPDTRLTFTDDDIEATVGGLSMLKLTETSQDLITLGPGSGDVDIDFNGDMFLQGSTGNFSIGMGAVAPDARVAIVLGPAGAFLSSDVLPDETDKNNRFTLRHYTNAEQDIAFFGGVSFVAETQIRFGGGYGLNNAATLLRFFTAADNITVTGVERMRIVANGRISIGNVATPLAQLHIDQESGSGAIPVMILDQADVDKPFTKYIGTAAAATLTRSIVAEGDVTTATRQGFVKIEIEDVGNQVTDQDYYVPFYTLA